MGQRVIAAAVFASVLAGGASWAQDSTPPATPPAPPTNPAATEPAPEAPAEDPYKPSVVEELRSEAAAVLPSVRCVDVRRFLIATSFLPIPEDRVLHWSRETRAALTPEEFERLAPEARETFQPVTFTSKDYYYTRYGSPLAYARPLELACQYFTGQSPLRSRRVLDFGYGTVGHLRLLASIGVHSVGVDVDPRLPALYSRPEDTGTIPGIVLMSDTCPDGTVSLAHGRWPADAEVAATVGGGFDLIMSKNTLKNGYINPEREVDKRMLVDLGVPNEAFVKGVADALLPGGIFLIYNLSPAQKQNPDEWIPWADGRCPFPREMLAAAGLEVLVFDASDDEAARALGKALGWDKGPSPMHLESDLFALYTVARKAATPPDAAAPATTVAP
ncbi:MAG: hypothetical protein SFY69_08740 [Planctomycetota bacterium]|nr:hypothetical protein [Planctomycetota bacterium]